MVPLDPYWGLPDLRTTPIKTFQSSVSKLLTGTLHEGLQFLSEPFLSLTVLPMTKSDLTDLRKPLKIIKRRNTTLTWGYQGMMGDTCRTKWSDWPSLTGLLSCRSSWTPVDSSLNLQGWCTKCLWEETAKFGFCFLPSLMIYSYSLDSDFLLLFPRVCFLCTGLL